MDIDTTPLQIQKPPDTESAAILWIAWEMTKQTSESTKASKLQKEFAANLVAVLDIWRTQGQAGEEEAVVLNMTPDVTPQPKKGKS